MATTNLNRLCLHAFCHETFKVRIDSPILRRNRVEAWFGASSSLCCSRCSESLVKRLLNGIEYARFISKQVAGKVPEKGLFPESANVAIVDDAGRCGRRGKSLCKRSKVLSSVRGTSSDINKRRNSWINSYFNLQELRFLLGGFVWYNLNNGVVTTSWSASAWIGTGVFRFCLLSILSISPGIRLYPVENMETSDGMDSKKRQ